MERTYTASEVGKHGNSEAVLECPGSQWKERLEQNRPLIERIYHAWEDEQSKKLFECLLRLQYTGEAKYLIEAIRLSGFDPDPALLQFKELCHWRSQGKDLILYGLGEIASYMQQLSCQRRGTMGYLYFPFVTAIDWTGYCDKNRRGTFGPEGKTILTPEEMLERYPDAMICVTAAAYESVRSDLIALGAAPDLICKYLPGNTRVFEDRQYFGEAFMPPRRERYVIDGGAFRFDTGERFLNWNRGCGFEGILSYEPDPENYEICREKLAALPMDEKARENSGVIHAGLSDQNSTASFSAKGSDASCFAEDGEEVVPLVSIDNTAAGRPVSFIKLDVEGFELQALRGAENTIRRCRPRIAVCAYHKREDLLDLPEWILNLDMGFRLRLRMYSNEYLEIVLYAY